MGNRKLIQLAILAALGISQAQAADAIVPVTANATPALAPAASVAQAQPEASAPKATMPETGLTIGELLRMQGEVAKVRSQKMVDDLKKASTEGPKDSTLPPPDMLPPIPGIQTGMPMAFQAPRAPEIGEGASLLLVRGGPEGMVALIGLPGGGEMLRKKGDELPDGSTIIEINVNRVVIQGKSVKHGKKVVPGKTRAIVMSYNPEGGNPIVINGGAPMSSSSGRGPSGPGGLPSVGGM